MLRRTPDARGAQPNSGSQPRARDTATAVGQPSNARQPATAPQRAYYPALMRSVGPAQGAATSTTGLSPDATPDVIRGAVRPNVTIAGMAAPLASASIARSVAPPSMTTAVGWSALSLLQRWVMPPQALPTEREPGRAFDAPAVAASGRQSDATVQRVATLAQPASGSAVPSVQRVANLPSASNAIAPFMQRGQDRSPLGGAVRRVANMSALLERMTAPPVMAYPTMTPTPLLHHRAAPAVDAGSSVQHAAASVQRFAPVEPPTVRHGAPHRSTAAVPWSLQRTPAALGSTLIERMASPLPRANLLLQRQTRGTDGSGVGYASPLPIANLLLQRQASPRVEHDAGRGGTPVSDTGAVGRTSAGTSAAYPQPLALLRTRPVASLAQDTQPLALSRTRSVEQSTPARGAASVVQPVATASSGTNGTSPRHVVGGSTGAASAALMRSAILAPAIVSPVVPSPTLALSRPVAHAASFSQPLGLLRTRPAGPPTIDGGTGGATSTSVRRATAVPSAVQRAAATPSTVYGPVSVTTHGGVDLSRHAMPGDRAHASHAALMRSAILAPPVATLPVPGDRGRRATGGTIYRVALDWSALPVVQRLVSTHASPRSDAPTVDLRRTVSPTASVQRTTPGGSGRPPHAPVAQPFAGARFAPPLAAAPFAPGSQPIARLMNAATSFVPLVAMRVPSAEVRGDATYSEHGAAPRPSGTPVLQRTPISGGAAGWAMPTLVRHRVAPGILRHAETPRGTAQRQNAATFGGMNALVSPIQRQASVSGAELGGVREAIGAVQRTARMSPLQASASPSAAMPGMVGRIDRVLIPPGSSQTRPSSSDAPPPMVQRQHQATPQHTTLVRGTPMRQEQVAVSQPRITPVAPSTRSTVQPKPTPALQLVRPATGAVQRVVEEASDDDGATESIAHTRAAQPIKPDIDALARQVYQHIRRRFMIDSERIGRL